MVKQPIYPPPTAWNFVSFGFGVFLCCSGYSVARAKFYQLELAEYKLQVGSVLSDVKKVSDTLEKVSNSSAIPPREKRKIKQLTNKTEEFIERAEIEIDLETRQLTEAATQE